MGLTGPQLDGAFGTGFSPVKFIKGFNAGALNKPATPVTNQAVDVTEQQHAAEITWNATTGELKLAAAPAGEGLWIPYLGNGMGHPGSKGWGTYSKAVDTKSWVATGPFSGCFVATFTGGGRRFAHLITPAGGYKAASVDDQIAAIKKATTSGVCVKWPMNGSGLGLAFFMKLPTGWVRRFVWVGPGGNVMQINAKSTAL